MEELEQITHSNLSNFNLTLVNGIISMLSILKVQYQQKTKDLQQQIEADPNSPSNSYRKNDQQYYAFIIHLINSIKESALTGSGTFDLEDLKVFLSNLCDVAEKIEYQLF